MIDVIKQLVEALEWCHGGEPVGTADAIKAGKQAIKDLESQERNFCPRCGKRTNDIHTCTPPQRTWVGLTDEEIDSYFENHGWSPSEYYYPVIKAIEAKLKRNNT